nr:PAS domain S-box protein [Peteryoungia desertarenae]
MAAPGGSQAVIIFKPDGTILDANENFCAAMGYRKDEVIGSGRRVAGGADIDGTAKHSDPYAGNRHECRCHLSIIARTGRRHQPDQQCHRRAGSWHATQCLGGRGGKCGIPSTGG